MGRVIGDFRLIQTKINREIWKQTIVTTTRGLGPALLAELGIFLLTALQRVTITNAAVSTAVQTKADSKIDCILDVTPKCVGKGSIPWGKKRKKRLPGPDQMLEQEWEQAKKEVNRILRGFGVRAHLPSRSITELWLRSFEETQNHVESIVVANTRCTGKKQPRCVKTMPGIKKKCLRKEAPSIR